MKQKNVPWLGIFIESLYTVLPVLSIINFVAIAIVLYTGIQPYLLARFPWIQLWMFLLVLAAIVLLLMLLAYKYLIPSMWTFRGKQMFGYESQILDELKKINERLGKLEK